MAKKIDLTGVKTFLFAQGEKIALGVFALFAVWLLYQGIRTGLQATGLDYGKDLQKSAELLKIKIDGTDYTPPDRPKGLEFEWKGRFPIFNWASLSPFEESYDKMRRNPLILAVQEGQIQMDFVRGGVFNFDVDHAKQQIWVLEGGKGGDKAGLATFVRKLEPIHMVVVSGVFPMKRQLMEFSNALKMSVEEIVAKKDDLPRPISLNIIKYEIKDGKAGDPQPLYTFKAQSKKKDQVEVAEPIDRLLRQTYIDEDNPAALRKYIMRGLVTPLPKLGNVPYPKLELEGIEDVAHVAADDGVMKQPKADGGGAQMPGKGGKQGKQMGMKLEGGQGNEGDIKLKKWTDKGSTLPKDVIARFEGEYNAFDPFGSFDEKGAGFPDIEIRKGGGGGMPGGQGKDGADMKGKGALPGGGDLKGKGGMPGGTDMKGKGAPGGLDKGKIGGDFKGPDMGGGQGGGDQAQLHDMLFRFFDVGAEPGKTYQYSIQVRMENPNFGKKELVAFGALAEEKELVSGVVATPKITIPSDYEYYAVDQSPEPLPEGMKGKPFTPGPDRAPIKLQPNTNYPLQTTLQIHKWVAGVNPLGGDEYPVSDWLIAERVLVSRGEYIGRSGMMVEAPTWNRKRNGFEIANVAVSPKLKAKMGFGLPVNFQLDPAPMVVDFEGGKRTHLPQIGSARIFDESAIDVLILNPDGTMTVRNSRHDLDRETDDGRERHDRHASWRERIRQLRNVAAPGGGGSGTIMPGKQ